MNTNNKSKKDILELLTSLIQSCEGGITGDWDSSIPNGEDGFLAMIEALETITVYVKIRK